LPGAGNRLPQRGWTKGFVLKGAVEYLIFGGVGTNVSSTNAGWRSSSIIEGVAQVMWVENSFVIVNQI